MLFQTNYKSLEGSNLLNWPIKEDVTVRKRIVSRNTVNAFMLELNAHIFANAKTVWMEVKMLTKVDLKKCRIF